MIDHERALELAASTLDFELSRTDDEALTAHLASCDDCRAIDEGLRADAVALVELDREDAPSALRERIVDAATSADVSGLAPFPAADPNADDGAAAARSSPRPGCSHRRGRGHRRGRRRDARLARDPLGRRHRRRRSIGRPFGRAAEFGAAELGGPGRAGPHGRPERRARHHLGTRRRPDGRARTRRHDRAREQLPPRQPRRDIAGRAGGSHQRPAATDPDRDAGSGRPRAPDPGRAADAGRGVPLHAGWLGGTDARFLGLPGAAAVARHLDGPGQRGNGRPARHGDRDHLRPGRRGRRGCTRVDRAQDRRPLRGARSRPRVRAGEAPGRGQDLYRHDPPRREGRGDRGDPRGGRPLPVRDGTREGCGPARDDVPVRQRPVRIRDRRPTDHLALAVRLGR